VSTAYLPPPLLAPVATLIVIVVADWRNSPLVPGARGDREPTARCVRILPW
jgi:hypothetical protein